MHVIIESPGFKASEALQSLIQEKLDHLEPMAHGVVRADVTLYSGPASDPEAAHCEIRLEVPGNDLFVKKAGADFEQAVHDATQTLHKQLRKAKETRIDSHRGERPDPLEFGS
jgi:putative sigma-54 modulation protein